MTKMSFLILRRKKQKKMSKRTQKDWLDKFLNLPVARRRKVQVFKQGLQSKKKSRKPRTEFDKNQLVEYVIEENIRTVNEFKRRAKLNPDAPSFWYVEKFFGKWSNLKREVFGEIKIFVNKSDEDILNLVAQTGIKNREDYLDCRSKEPHVFPSIYEVTKRFGGWQNFMRAVYAVSTKSIFERYFYLKQKIGRWPTNPECEEAGVEIHRLLQGISRKELKQFVNDIEAGIK